MFRGNSTTLTTLGDGPSRSISCITAVTGFLKSQSDPPLVQTEAVHLPLGRAFGIRPLATCTPGCADVEKSTWNTLKASTPVKLRWMGDAVPGRVVKSSFHLPSSSGDCVGACAPLLALYLLPEADGASRHSLTSLRTRESACVRGALQGCALLRHFNAAPLPTTYFARQNPWTHRDAAVDLQAFDRILERRKLLLRQAALAAALHTADSCQYRALCCCGAVPPWRCGLQRDDADESLQ